jgi:hypothetical protein
MRLHPHHSHYIEPAFTSSLGAQYKDLEGQKGQRGGDMVLLPPRTSPDNDQRSNQIQVSPQCSCLSPCKMSTVEAMQVSHQAHLRARQPRTIGVGVLVIGFRNRYPHPAIFLSAQTLDQNVGTWHILEVIERAKWFVSWICNSYGCSSIASVSL